MAPRAQNYGLVDTPVKIFDVEDTALAVQGHPEFNLNVQTDLIKDRRAKGVLTVGRHLKHLYKLGSFFC